MAASGGSPSPTTSSATSASSLATLALTSSSSNPPPSWWESVSKARSAIISLSSILPASATVASLADSDRPATSLLSSSAAYGSVSLSLSSSPVSGSGSDPICHWLYDTYISSDPDLRLIVLSFLPLISSLYLSRLPSPSSSLSGFEAVILAIYSAEVKSRGGKPLIVSVPDLSLPSLYHTPPKPAPATSNPRSPRSPTKPKLTPPPTPSVSVLSAPLEPQIAVKSTKRASILAACFDAYYYKISLMPSCSKVDLCEIIATWAGQFCPCRRELDEDQHDVDPLLSSPSSSSSIEVRCLGEEPDTSALPFDDVSKEIGALQIREGDQHCSGGEDNGLGTGGGTSTRSKAGSRVPLPWELLQPLLRILGHCLLGPLSSDEVKDAASVAVRCVYARASHELMPQAILASRSLIQLDKSARDAARAMATTVGQQNSTAGSSVTTPTKQKLQEVIMGSK
ncbi:hyccin [Carex rostrata]